jgi:putative ABC transport system permease protein
MSTEQAVRASTRPALRMKSSLSIRDLVGEAAAAITRRPGRSLLTALGTVVGVGAFVATTGLASTARAQVGEAFDALAATEVRVTDSQAQGAFGSELAEGIDHPFPVDSQQRLERLNGVEHAGLYWEVEDDDLDVRLLAPPSSRPQSIRVMGVSPGALEAAHPDVRTGRVFDEFAESRAERVVVLGRIAAEQLGITRVDNQPAIFIGDRPYTVLGIVDDVVRVPELLQAVMMPAATATADFVNEGVSYKVLIEVAPGAAQVIASPERSNVVGPDGEPVSQAAMALRPQDPGRLEVLAPPDPGELKETIESDITGLLYGLAGLALLVGMIGIANTTLVAVLERRSEIGVRRALGARRRHIASQFLTESATLGTLGGILGTSLGILVVVFVSAQREWTTTLDPRLTIPAPIIGAITGLLAGLQPSWRAARITPAAALRAE